MRGQPPARPDPAAKLTPDVLLQILHDYEVPFTIGSRPDEGFCAVFNGAPFLLRSSSRSKELSVVVDWLVAEVLRLQAYSDFAVHYRSIAPSGHLPRGGDLP